MDLREELFKSRDLKYRDFHKKLVPNIDAVSYTHLTLPTTSRV